MKGTGLDAGAVVVAGIENAPACGVCESELVAWAASGWPFSGRPKKEETGWGSEVAGGQAKLGDATVVGVVFVLVLSAERSISACSSYESPSVQLRTLWTLPSDADNGLNGTS